MDKTTLIRRLTELWVWRDFIYAFIGERFESGKLIACHKSRHELRCLRRLALEPLERRSLLAVSVGWTEGVGSPPLNWLVIQASGSESIVVESDMSGPNYVVVRSGGNVVFNGQSNNPQCTADEVNVISAEGGSGAN